MAISKTIKLKDNFGIEVTFENAYIKIVYINGSKDVLHAHVCTYDKKDGVQLNSVAVECPLSLEGKNFIAQAYDYVKTQPEFAGAVDC
jgi:hypothetical protein